MRRVCFLLTMSGFLACNSETVPPPKDPASATEPTPVAVAPQNGSPNGPPVVTGEEGRPNEEWGILDRNSGLAYGRVVEKVGNMVTDSDLQSRVRRQRLALVNVMWEDTGRAQGSSLGPNISDLTLQVRRRDAESGRFVSTLMPVIRPPNFVDRTGDVPADKFFIRVGNERGQGVRSVPLNEVLRDIRSFVSDSSSIAGNGNLTAPRDSHFLVSAQAVFLPIPQQGKAEFNPVLFNYQSAPGSPAVLTLLVTREGTSVSVIENRKEDSSAAVGAGQELYFNNKGQRSAFTAERRTDVKARIDAKGGPTTEEERSQLAKGADVLFLVQVPLKHAQRGRLGGALPPGAPAEMASGSAAQPKKASKPMAAAPSAAGGAMKDEASDVEQAVLGHGPNLGPYREGRGARLERDPAFPIRVTVQFYKATSNGVVSDVDLDAISKSIGSVYEHAEFVGSLVVPEGDPRRPTSWQKIPREWFPW